MSENNRFALSHSCLFLRAFCDTSAVQFNCKRIAGELCIRTLTFQYLVTGICYLVLRRMYCEPLLIDRGEQGKMYNLLHVFLQKSHTAIHLCAISNEYHYSFTLRKLFFFFNLIKEVSITGMIVTLEKCWETRET